MGDLVKAFSEVVKIVKENPKESATVALVGLSFLAGRGVGYREGRKDGDNFYNGNKLPQAR